MTIVTYRRMIDLSLLLFLLPIAVPLIAILGLLAKVTSSGPAFFVQTRVGRGGKSMRLWKIRSMKVGSEKNGPAITSANDQRVTPLGTWLRRTKLDELPQLWNVLKGDMSLIGPRPESPKYVQLQDPQWQKILEVRPGITDYASLVFRHEEKLLASSKNLEEAYRKIILPAKLELSLEAIERASLIFDLSILYKTALTLILTEHQNSHPLLLRVQKQLGICQP